MDKLECLWLGDVRMVPATFVQAHDALERPVVFVLEQPAGVHGTLVHDGYLLPDPRDFDWYFV